MTAPCTRLNSDMLSEYTRDELQSELDYLGIHYTDKTQTYMTSTTVAIYHSKHAQARLDAQ